MRLKENTTENSGGGSLSIAEQKNALRKTLRKTRAPEVEAPARSLVETAGKIASEFNTLFTFISTAGEPDTSPFVAAFGNGATNNGKTVLAPRIHTRRRHMEFLPLPEENGGLLLNAFGIHEPREGRVLFSTEEPQPAGEEAFAFPAFVLVPGMAFTTDGRRLGRGGGYYDTFLAVFLRRFAKKRRQIKTAGFCFPGQILQDIPVEPHDVKMDCLILTDGSIIDTEN